MNIKEYQELAMRTADDNGQTIDLAIRTLGLVGECGEVSAQVEGSAIGEALHHQMSLTAARIAEGVKKHVGHGKPMDRANLIKELGDVLWYVTAIASWFEISLEDVAVANTEKLKARYPDGFVRASESKDSGDRDTEGLN